MTDVLLAFVVVALALVAARRMPSGWATRLDGTRYLEGRSAPWIIGAFTTLIFGVVWGHVHPTAVVHDEASYLLQARIFARFAFSMPARPLPEFFEQFHTYVTPAFASKYPPGHALLMTPGVWLGMPSLVPLLLDGLAGALIFLLARRVTNPWVALFTWLLWITARATHHHVGSFFSQSSSGAIWLLGWWALLEWRDRSDRRWLWALSACVGWLAITRPLTALAYALPIAIVVLVLAARRRVWKEVMIGAAIGSAILMLIPYANLRTTGDWRIMPYSQYSQIYFPFDVPGFGMKQTPPQRALPHDMVQFGQAFGPVHAKHTPARLRGALLRRVVRAAAEVWSGPRVVFAVTALAAIPLIGVEVGFALLSMATLFLFYLSFAHDPGWTLYYSEVMPVFTFLSALGLWRLLASASALRRGDAAVRRDPRPAALCAVLALLLMIGSERDLSAFRQDRLNVQAFQRNFAEVVASLPEPKTIVFIRYAPWHVLHYSLIANDPDLESSHAWLVYDRGPDNVRLQRVAPERMAYLFDEERHRIDRLPAVGATAPGVIAKR